MKVIIRITQTTAGTYRADFFGRSLARGCGCVLSAKTGKALPSKHFCSVALAQLAEAMLARGECAATVDL